jgi:hypothetical protein
LSLEAIADFGWIFDAWSGDLDETENPTSIIMDSDKQITITFTEKPKYSLEINIVGNGTVEVDGEEYATPMMVYEDSEISLQAIPASGWKFDEWSGDITGTTNPKIFTVTTNSSITATFTQSTSSVIDLLSEINIFPNPFVNSLNITNAQQIRTIVVTNLIGQKVLEMQFSGQETINLSTNDFVKGIYLISLGKSSGERIVKKIVKR